MLKYFDCLIRTRYSETDQMGVCYYGNYLTWFEVARTEYFREAGLPYTEFEKEGIYLPVAESYCRYKKPIYYDDEIIIKTYIVSLRRTSIKFFYKVYRKTNLDNLLSEGWTVHVFVDKNMKACAVPEIIYSKVEVVDE